MPTLKMLCSAGCGIAGIGTASALTARHWSGFGSGVTNVLNTDPSGPDMPGTRTYKFVSAANAVDFTTHTYLTAIASAGSQVLRIKIQFSTLPNGIRTIISENGGRCGVRYNPTGTKLEAWAGATPVLAGSFVPSVDTTYMLEVRFIRGTTHTTEWKVDGVAQTTASQGGQSASTQTGFTLGSNTTGSGGNVAATATYYINMIAASGTDADFPIGDGKPAVIFPNADGSHTYNSATDFGDGATGTDALATPSSAQTDTWQSLENPLATADGAKKVGAINADITLTGDRPAEFLRFAFEDLPGDVGTLNGVMLVVTTDTGSATACNHTLHIDDGTNTPPAAIINADLSEGTGGKKVVSVVMSTVAGDGGAWTVAKLNATLLRFSSSDVTPDVFLCGACFEVDYVAAAAPGLGLPRRNAPRRAALAHYGGF